MADPDRRNENVCFTMSLQAGPVVVVTVTFPDNEEGDVLHVKWKQALYGQEARSLLQNVRYTVPLRRAEAATAPVIRLEPRIPDLPQHHPDNYDGPVEGIAVDGLHPHDLVVLLVENPETGSQLEVGGLVLDMTYKMR